MFYFETLSTLFTFEKGMIKISNVSLLYCHCHFVLSTKRGFSSYWDPEKVSVVRRCPLRTVRCIEVSLQKFHI